MQILGYILIIAVAVFILSSFVWMSGTLFISMRLPSNKDRSSNQRSKVRKFHEWLGSIFIMSLMTIAAVLMIVATRALVLAI